MAGGRRGGSADLRDALMALVRTTLDQVGVVREIAVKQAQNQKTFLDQALIGRRRKDALVRLGEEVYARLLDGELVELAENAAIAEVIAELAELDDAMTDAETPAHQAPADWDRSRARHSRGGARMWRPGGAAEPAEGDEAAPRRRRRPSGAGRGGIQFVDDDGADDDLADYMHDDDVPDDR